jgi:hypothetical protein
VPCFEAAILDARHQQVWNQKNYCRLMKPGQETTEEESDEEESEWKTSVDLGLALMDGSYGDTLGKIGRHETSLMNAFAKTLQTLLLLQRDRADDAAKLKVIELPRAASRNELASASGSATSLMTTRSGRK